MRLLWKRTWSFLGFALVLGSTSACVETGPDDDVLIAAAKEVVATHEREVLAGNLDGVVANHARDMVALVPGAPLVQGLDAFRGFYGPMLAGTEYTEFTHDYSGEAVVGSSVVLHGTATATFLTPEGTPMSMENNFLMVLKPDEAGVLKFWRVAFAPASM